MVLINEIMVLPMKWAAKIFLAILVLNITLFSMGRVKAQEEKPLIVTTTSVLSSIVEDLAKGKVEVEYIVPPSLCPGHYDVKPSDVELIRSADLILKHGIMGEYWLEDLINTANQTGDLHVPIVEVGAGWNTPTGARNLYSNVANAISEYLGIDISDRLTECMQAINNTEAELKEIAEENNFNEISVVVMLWQKPFVEFLGFRVVATYGPPEKVSERDIAEVEDNATKYGARLVIDNLHSGTSLGEKIANDVGAVHVVLINFPGTMLEVNNLTAMMLYNAKLLADAVDEYEYRAQIQTLERKVSIWQYATVAIGIIALFEAMIIAVMVKRGKKIE